MIQTIEDNGREVIITPYSEYIKIVADPVVRRRLKEGRYLEYAKTRFLTSLIPSYCCPSLVTEAMKSRIEEMTGVPVVTIEYDGTTAIKNEVVIPYLKFRGVKNKA